MDVRIAPRPADRAACHGTLLCIASAKLCALPPALCTASTPTCHHLPSCPQIIPGNNPNHLAYATGVFNGGLYLVNPTTGTATQVIDFGIDAHPHLLAPANAEVSAGPAYFTRTRGNPRPLAPIHEAPLVLHCRACGP